MLRGAAALVVLAACHQGPGEPLVELVCGCFEPCGSTEVRRAGDQLELLVRGPRDGVLHASHGALTPAGAAALAEAAERFGPELVDELDTCVAVDGCDRRVTLERDGQAYTLTYCVDSNERGIGDLSALLDAIEGALKTCEDNLFVEVGACMPTG